MFCCPIAKSALMIGGLALLGFTGWEASACFSAHVQGGGQENVPGHEWSSDESCCTTAPRAAILTAKGSSEAEDCCEPGSNPSTARAVSTSTAAIAEGWANVKGQVVFGGDAVPKPEEFKVTADQEHCLKNGPAMNVVWNVNPSNKGLVGIVVFINPDRDEKLEVHPDLKETPKPFVLDQPNCVFTPRIFAVRAGQTITAKNPDQTLHNVVMKGLKNDLNVQVPIGTEKPMNLQAETNAITVACGSHPWMKGFCWCFDHPYFAVTDKDGKFEIKNIPAGNRKIVIWHETGYLPGYSKRDQKTLNLAAGGTTDIGTVKAMPK